MKKKFVGIVFALVCILALTACNQTPAPSTPPAGHEHNYQWVDNGDGTHKQHCSVDGCDAPDIDTEPHVWGTDDKCTKCPAVKPNGETPTPPATHSHEWSLDWQSNDTHHWHNCTADGCDVTDNTQKDGYAAHDFTNGDCVCGKRDLSTPTEGIEYALNTNNTNYYVKSIGSAVETNIIIASVYNGKPVTSIGSSAFKSCNSLTSIIIPDGIKSIGGEAFYDCSSLTSVKIPDSVMSIGYRAFNGCSKLQYNEYDNACYLGNDTNPYAWLIKAKNSSITSCTIHKNTIFIYWSAFYNCSGLTDITVPSSVISIGASAFYDCNGLAHITIPNNVTSVGFYAFTGCSSLQYNEYDNAYYLGNDMNPYVALIKAKNTSITSCTIHEDTKVIAHEAFRSSSITSIAIPDSLTNIGDHAFTSCSKLTSITIPNNIPSIETYSFYSCGSIEKIYYAGNLKSWCEANELNYLMRYGKSTKTLTIDGKEITGNLVIPDGITSIPSYAFSGCSGLTSITIPNSLTSIGDYAFNNCSSLTSIIIPDNVLSIKNYAFDDCSSLTIFCESSSKPSEWNSNWNSDCPVIWDCKNNDKDSYGCAYAVIGGIRYSLQDGMTKDGRATIATVIRQPSNIIGNVTIPATVIYNNTECIVTTIGEKAFYCCNKMTSLTIPDSVTKIESSAFRGCHNLTNVMLGNHIKHIGSYSLCDCRSLTNITFHGTKAQWHAITKGGSWNSNTGDYTVICTDGKLDKDGNENSRIVESNMHTKSRGFFSRLYCFRFSALQFTSNVSTDTKTPCHFERKRGNLVAAISTIAAYRMTISSVTS